MRTLAAAPLLELVQKALLSVMIFVVANRFYYVLWAAPTQAFMLEEMRAILLMFGDFALIPLVIVSGVRLLLDVPYRDLLRSFTLKIVAQGGIGWFLLIVWVAVGTLWAIEPSLVRFGAIQVAGELLCMLLLGELVSRGWLGGVCWAVVIGTSAQGLLAIVQAIHQGPLGIPVLNESPLRLFDIYRSFGWTINPNNLAGYVLLGCFACLILIRLRIERRQSPLLPLLCGLLIVGGLIATQSRAALAGLCAGLVFILIFQRGITFHRRTLIRWGIPVLVLGGWGALVLFGNRQDRLNFGIREFLFPDTLAIIQQTPLLGVGIHNLMQAIAVLHANEPAGQLLLPVHNVYVMMWAEVGVPGVLLFFFSYLALIVETVRRRDPILLTLAAFLIAVALIMLVDFYFWGDHRSRMLIFYAAGIWWGVRLASATSTEQVC